MTIFGEKEVKIDGSVFPVLATFNGKRNEDGTGSLILFSNELLLNNGNISINTSNIMSDVVFDPSDSDHINFYISLQNIWKKKMIEIGYK